MDDVNRILNEFWKQLGEIERITGFPRAAIALAMCRLSKQKSREWEAGLWKSTHSRHQLKAWIERYGEEAHYDDQAFLEIARLLPSWAKRNLAQMSKGLGRGRGGNRKFHYGERLEVERRFLQLTRPSGPRRAIPRYKAYEKIQAEWKHKGKKISIHAIRIICDKRERERTLRHPKIAAMVLEERSEQRP